MNLRARQHFKIVVVMVFCLLFQQVAMAAYACPLEQMPPRMEAMAEHCAGMGMQQARDNPALCAKHCAPDLATAADHVLLTVPALLPPTGLTPVPQVEVDHCVARAAVSIAQSDPPPRLRFCSLLI